MALISFLEKLNRNETIHFNEVITIIDTHYHYHPVSFTNGWLVNAAGTNEGSCKVLAFAKKHQLNQQQTLNLFGDYYRQDVLITPHGTNHQNIRNFMLTGWSGVQFDADPLAEK